MRTMIYLIYFLLVFYIKTAAVSIRVEPDASKANRYLIEKWERWFNANDFNRDRVLSMDDIKLFENYYKDLGYLSDEHLKEINKRTDRIWRKIILNNTLEITKDDFVEMLKQKYESNKEVFTEMMREYISDWCETMDLNDDYFISKEEFLTNVFASRHNTIAADDELFQAFKPVNGRFPVKTMINYFIRSATDTNESTSDVFQDALDSGFK